ncbi:protein PBDC1 [Teleopsis dalmanni]|uniref:protein PBDC1 n=1 Tax=Teleopsis dalmanni TaxID=139649 RepID=UPI000D32BEB8|nr:protein PBDC1 [Teleopsis dalmanni]
MEMLEAASLLSRPAEEFGNDSLVEEMWAVKAMEHAEVHFNLLVSVHPSCIRLTPFDDQIYQTFRQDFPDLKIDVLTDDILKSTDAKNRWRQFSQKFSKLEDYSYGTLLRADAKDRFCPENALLVVRIQFLAIEIARNREGLNDVAHNTFKPSPRDSNES